jgi:hypothetical protein
MRNIKNPYQAELISRVDYLISPEAAKILQDYWHGIFRTTILELLPVEKISKYYSPDMGRPTKELYSMLGLIFIKYFMGWTDEETALQYSLNFPSYEFILQIAKLHFFPFHPIFIEK